MMGKSSHLYYYYSIHSNNSVNVAKSINNETKKIQLESSSVENSFVIMQLNSITLLFSSISVSGIKQVL